MGCGTRLYAFLQNSGGGVGAKRYLDHWVGNTCLLCHGHLLGLAASLHATQEYEATYDQIRIAALPSPQHRFVAYVYFEAIVCSRPVESVSQ